MAMFSLGRASAAETRAAVDWVRSPKGKFYSLLAFNSDFPELRRVSGVFIIWNGGVKPTWLYAGRSQNLEADLKALARNDDILYYHKHGGLFVTWAPIKAEYQAGVLKHLQSVMKPEIDNPDQPGPEVSAIPVMVPKAREKERA